MRIAGEWLQFDDGVTRPTIEAQVVGAGGNPVGERFLVDTGADRLIVSRRRGEVLLLAPAHGYRVEQV